MNLSGSGVLGVSVGSSTGSTSVPLSGSGALTLAALPVKSVTATFTGAGAATATLDQVFVEEMDLTILDDTVIQAPTVILAMVTGGWADQPVDFSINGTVVYSDTLDSDGELGPIVIEIADQTPAGSYTLTVVGTDGEQTIGASAPFTLLKDPPYSPRLVGADTAPVAIPAAVTATGVQRWVLQDLMPNGLGSFVMARNPATMSALPFSRTLSQEHSTALTGSFHVTEPGEEAHPFSFTGLATTQSEAETLTSFSQLNRRWYLIDHRNRAWTVVSVGLDLVPRKRYADPSGQLNDWGHDYTFRVLIHGTDWKTPQ